MNDAANCMHRQFTESQSYCPDCGLSRSEVLVAACEPYLKDEETPAECIARNRRDVDGCLTMLVAEKRKTEALQAKLAYVTQTLALLVDDDNRPVEALARHAVARLAEAERVCADAREFILLHCPLEVRWPAELLGRLTDVTTGRTADSASVCLHQIHNGDTCEICGAKVTPVVQPERCCVDYPRCDCNSPPEPDDDWLCFQRPAQPKVTP